MPLDKYYGGHGKKVMGKMRGQYGDEQGERVFYATANKRKTNARRDKLIQQFVSKQRR